MAIRKISDLKIIVFVRGFLDVFDVVLSCISRRGVRLDDPQLWVVTGFCIGKDTFSNISINKEKKPTTNPVYLFNEIWH